MTGPRRHAEWCGVNCMEDDCGQRTCLDYEGPCNPATKPHCGECVERWIETPDGLAKCPRCYPHEVRAS